MIRPIPQLESLRSDAWFVYQILSCLQLEEDKSARISLLESSAGIAFALYMSLRDQLSTEQTSAEDRSN